MLRVPVVATLVVAAALVLAGCDGDEEEKCLPDWSTGCEAGGLDLSGPHCCSGRCVELGENDFCMGRDPTDGGPDAGT